MKTTLIIGASGGIGGAMTASLSDAGQRVIGTYNNTLPETEHPLVEYHQLNVLDPDPSLDFVPEQIDGLVYAPGSINLKPFHRISPEEFMNDYELQVIGAIRVIQAVLKNLRQGTDPSIVLFSTVAVQKGFRFHSQVSASKGAIEGLTKALAAEYAPGIRVNCIAPSLTDTRLASSLLNTDAKREANADRHPMKRIGRPDDIAKMGVFLLSEASGWITGQLMHVDGGMSTITQ